MKKFEVFLKSSSSRLTPVEDGDMHRIHAKAKHTPETLKVGTVFAVNDRRYKIVEKREQTTKVYIFVRKAKEDGLGCIQC